MSTATKERNPVDLERFKKATAELAEPGHIEEYYLNLACWLGERAHFLVDEIAALRAQVARLTAERDAAEQAAPLSGWWPKYLLSAGEHEGFPFVVLNSGHGYRCGYVRLPQDHPWRGLTFDHEAFRATEVHGGLTVSREDHEGNRWIGFDCGHLGDLTDAGLPIAPGCAYIPDGWEPWPTARVEAECRRLCEQAKDAVKEGGTR